MRIKIWKNTYKGDGKAWIAQVDENGKIQKFMKGTYTPTNGTGRGAYEYEIEYDLPNGEYLAHTTYTKSQSVRQYFRIQNGQITFEKWFYPGGKREFYPGKCPGKIEIQSKEA